MSRSYAYKPELKKHFMKAKTERKVVLADYDLELLEMSLGPNIRLQV